MLESSREVTDERRDERASAPRFADPVRTPLGDAWMLNGDEPAIARLLPSGDAYFLLWGEERALLVSDAVHRDELWTPRVWPGAVLLDGESAEPGGARTTP